MSCSAAVCLWCTIGAHFAVCWSHFYPHLRVVPTAGTKVGPDGNEEEEEENLKEKGG